MDGVCIAAQSRNSMSNFGLKSCSQHEGISASLLVIITKSFLASEVARRVTNEISMLVVHLVPYPNWDCYVR